MPGQGRRRGENPKTLCEGNRGSRKTKKVCLIGRRTKRRAFDRVLLLDLRHKIFQPVHTVVRRLLLLHHHRSHPAGDAAPQRKDVLRLRRPVSPKTDTGVCFWRN